MYIIEIKGSAPMEKLPIAERIKKFRTEKNLSQTELGNLLGVSNRAVSKWEKGEAYPTIDTLVTLSNFISVGVVASVFLIT